MPPRTLTEKQKEMVRTLASGLKDRTIANEIEVRYDDGRLDYVNFISGYAGYSKPKGWEDIDKSDLDALEHFGFLQPVVFNSKFRPSRYKLDLTSIIEEVETDFAFVDEMQEGRERIRELGRKFKENTKKLIAEELDNRLRPSLEIQNGLAKFRRDRPDTAKTAFIMMSFSDTRAHEEIVRVIKDTLALQNIEGIRADDRRYHDELFPNIQTYLYGCGFGIAVFERIEADAFNPNVSLEVGYMFGLGKPVCLLKDRTLKDLPTDLVGRLYETFDPQDISGTIPKKLNKWLSDKILA